MRFLVRSWEYRRPRLWVGVRVACGIFNVVLGVLLLASVARLGPLTWLAVIPLAGAALIFWTVYRLQQDSVGRVRELEASRARVVDDSAARLRRIERDLHDGTQAQLVAVAMRLGLAKEKLDGTATRTGRARPRPGHRAGRRGAPGAKEAIAELRDLARGIHPPVLDRPRRRAGHAGRAQRGARRARPSTCPAPVGRDRDHRLLLRRRTARQRGQAQRRPARHARGRARCPACCGSASPTTGRRRPPRPSAAAWPGWPNGSVPWTAGCEVGSPAGGPTVVDRRAPVPRLTAQPMRIVIAEDSAVIRAGLAELLADRGHEVIAAVGDAERLLRRDRRAPAGRRVVDIRMPPGYTDEGLRAAIAIRRDHPRDRHPGVLPVHRDPLRRRPARRGVRAAGRLPAQGPGRRRRGVHRRAQPGRRRRHRSRSRGGHPAARRQPPRRRARPRSPPGNATCSR